MQAPERALFARGGAPLRWKAGLPAAAVGAPPLAEAVVPVRPPFAAAQQKGAEAAPPVSAVHAMPAVPSSQQQQPLEAVTALFVIYDADGTPAGELIYMTKKLLGLGHCAACDITHGPRREKPEFTRLKTAGWGVPLVNIHRDEMDPALAAAVAGHLPCVAARTSQRDVVLLGQEALATCDGDVVRFQEVVDLALRVHRLTAPCAPRHALSFDVAAEPVPAAMEVTFAAPRPAATAAEGRAASPGAVPAAVPPAQRFARHPPPQQPGKWEWRALGKRGGLRREDDAVVPGPTT